MRLAFRQYGRLSLNLTCAAFLGMAILWSLNLDTGLGFRLHFSALPFATLLIGPELALLAGGAATIALSLVLELPASAIPLSIASGTVLPVLLMHWLLLFERRRKSGNFFLFILGGGFGGGILTAAMVLVCNLLIGYAVSEEAWSGDHVLLLQYLPLVALPEGVLNGMLLTAFMVFAPEWVRTLDESRYDRRTRRSGGS